MASWRGWWWIGALTRIAVIVGCLQAPQAFAQFKISEAFTGATAPGWTLADSASLTATGIDAAGSGWLRLTSANLNLKGTALYTAGSFSPTQPFVLRFNYVSWGGTGADGMSVFLFDPNVGMANAQNGGGLGYCVGDGGYLAVALDEFGNFSNPADSCAAGGGPGLSPQNLVIRGPIATGNAYVTGVGVPGGSIDAPLAASRPTPHVVNVTMTPDVTGYRVTVNYQDTPGAIVQTVISNVSFPYVAPAQLSVGFSGATGAQTNFHEIQNVAIAATDDIAVVVNGPVSVIAGGAISYSVTVTNNGPVAVSGVNAPTLVDNFPASLTGVSWTCSGSAGASCTSAGSGSINTSTLTLPVGGSVTYQVTATVSPATACGSGSPLLVNSANADFGASAGFLDVATADNTGSVSTAVACVVTTPGPFSFTPVTGVAPSSVQTSNTITVSGINSAAPISIGSGCQYSVNGGPFTATAGTVPPGATVAVRQTAPATGLTTSTCTLNIGGVSAPYAVTTAAVTTPGPFSFTPVTGVAPSSVQTSNTITVSGINSAAPISIGSGCQYSVNGGPFTATAGTVPPGATVAVRQTAPATGLTTSTCTLDIGGVSAPYAVTTAAVPGALSFSSGTYSANGANSSATVTVTRAGGSNGAVSVDILNAAGTIVGTANFANNASSNIDVVIPLTNLAAGGTLPLRLATPVGGATVGAIPNATITVAAAPLGEVVVESRGGGGSMSALSLLLMGALLGWQWLRRARSGAAPSFALVLLLVTGVLGGGVASAQAVASDDVNDRGPFIGLRAGASTSSLTSSEVTSYLQERGFKVTANTARTAPAGTAYFGYAFTHHWAVEAGYSFIGRTRSVLTGTVPPDLQALFRAGVDAKLGAGEAGLLNLRYRWPLSERAGIDFRAGRYQGKNKTTIYINDVNRYTETDGISGTMFGLGPYWKIGRHWSMGLSIEQFRSSSRNRFLQALLGVEYRFRNPPAAALATAPVVAEQAPPPAAVPPTPLVAAVVLQPAPPPAPLDSDGDGVPDALDQCPGSPPGIAVDAIGCETAEFVLRGVNFETDSAVLLPAATAILDRVAQALRQRTNRLAEIRGYTDSVGADDHNQRLSERRAQAVVEYLVAAGVAASQLIAKGFGETQPLATNATAAGRAENRRVSIQLSNAVSGP